MKSNLVFKAVEYFSSLKMARLRNKRKSADTNKDNQEEHLKNKQARGTNASGIQEDYFTQVSEEKESRVTKNFPRRSVRQRIAFWEPCPS